MGKFWIGTSWKMNKTLAGAMQFTDALGGETGDGQIQRFVIPSFTTIRQVKDALKDSDILVGAQNMHWADAGAWTGEVSPLMLRDCGADLVELGHSERRTHFNETDETVGKKVAAAVKHALIPLICVGETAPERDQGRARDVLSRQVTAALEPVAGQEVPVLLAYEPVWAIGDGGEPASADYAQERHLEIKDLAARIMGRDVPCLYGGSVNRDNAVELARQSAINGLFIGRAAWDASGYLSIIRDVSQSLSER